MKTDLFNDFRAIGAKEWKQKIQVDLKGTDYQTLITHTLEGVDIKPFYHADTYKHFKNNPQNDFNIGQELWIRDEKTARHIAQKALQKGADYFVFYADKTFDINLLINELDYSRIIIKLDFLDTNFFLQLYQKTQGKAQIFIDPIGHFAQTGNWYKNQDTDFKNIKVLQEKLPSDYTFININTAVYKNGGANIVQELSYALSHTVEYLENFGADTAKQISFTFAVGNHYFFEIAKFQVFRNLLEMIFNEYKASVKPLILAQPGLRNKTIFDPYVNMLRSTMEMMSAVLGGANIISNLPYDSVYKKSNEFSERIARNQLIILKEEAYFTEALNSFEGNYYLENISHQLAEKSLELFKLIEKSGGLLAQLYKGKIQEKIAENAQKEQAFFDKGELVLVGTNKYINADEIPENIDFYPFMKKRSGQTLIRPVIAKRLAENLEAARLKKLNIHF
jgi:methylmalonyl-CoA mutase